MQGENLSASTSSMERGLIPRSLQYIFAKIQSAQMNNNSLDYLVKCNYLEIYNKRIIDLVGHAPAVYEC